MGLIDSRGVSSEGTETEHVMYVVAQLVGGRILRQDWYDLADHAAAQARFEELAAADLRTPVLDNDAVRAMVRLLWLGRYDFARSGGMFSPDVEYTDRRGVIALPTFTGVDGLFAVYTSVFEVYDELTGEPMAVRGERLALWAMRMSTEGGSESVARMLVGLDGEGRIDAMVGFDADDLAGAVHELDSRYLEGEGTDHAWMIRPSMEFWRSYNARDWDGARRVVADEVELVDLRLASAGTSIQTADEFVTYAQGMIELVPDLVAFEAEYLAMGRTWWLTRQVAYGTSTEGAEIERPSLILARSRDGRFTHTETFEPEQIAEALARLEELESAEPPVSTTALSNRATKNQEVYNSAFAVLDWDAMAASYADDIVSDDRRTGVSSGVMAGREDLLELVRGLVDVGFTAVTTVPIAIRGEALALVRRTWHQAAGFDLPVLAVIEVDADDQLTRNVMFDAEDLLGAVAELERRYLAGEGAVHADVLDPASFDCYNRRDWDGFLANVADDFDMVDHRPASAGTSIRSAAQFREWAEGMVALVPDFFVIEQEHLRIGRRWVLSRQYTHGTSTAGAEIESPLLALSDGPRCTHSEIFLPEQLAEALARFEELEAAEPAGPTSSLD